MPFFTATASVLFAASLLAVEPVPVHRVVVIVFDGMRPDFVSEETTPHLWQLAQRGVFFSHHHSVFLSSTEVNGTAIATGAYPSHSFVVANTDFRPAIDLQKPVDIQDPSTIKRGDQVSNGHYLGRPTVAELLHARGVATAIAGTKQVVLLHDRLPRVEGPGTSAIAFEGETFPPALARDLSATLGDFPATGKAEEKSARDAWTTQAFLRGLWKEGVPAYSLLWLAEPDFSQHATGPGSPQSLAAIASSDRNLGLVLAELKNRGLLDTTDVLVVSDHGFSTINRKVDIAVELSVAGFQAKRVAPAGLQPGDVLVVKNGGASLLYVGGHDAAVSRRLVTYLQSQDWTGVILSRQPFEGTFPLAEANIDSPEAPDLVVSLRWTRGLSSTGIRGLQASDLAASSNKIGNHGSLSPYDLHNTLIAAGPDFKKGVADTLPSANTDIAPTVLWCLGFPEDTKQMDGRVLSEALLIDAPPLKSYETKRLIARRAVPGSEWAQYLQISEVNGVRYLDEGNRESLTPSSR